MRGWGGKNDPGRLAQAYSALHFAKAPGRNGPDVAHMIKSIRFGMRRASTLVTGGYAHGRHTARSGANFANNVN